MNCTKAVFLFFPETFISYKTFADTTNWIYNDEIKFLQITECMIVFEFRKSTGIPKLVPQINWCTQIAAVQAQQTAHRIYALSTRALYIFFWILE